MSLTTKASDWEVLGICQIGAAATLGGGVWFFKFRSQQAGVDEMVNFSAVLLGLGGSIGGISLPKLSGQLPYSAIQCSQSFSLYDLTGSMGRVTTAGGSAVVGFSLLFVSAFNLSGHLYESQPCHGFVGGVGLNAVTSVGTWTKM